MTEHPMQPSPEQFGEWLAEALRQFPAGPSGEIAAHVARLAYAAGADAELEACREWLREAKNHGFGYEYGAELARKYIAARRPNPPSLKQQAIQRLDGIEHGAAPSPDDYETIRRALDALPDD
jgi:hypothetical protein